MLETNLIKDENCSRISCKDAIYILYNEILKISPYLLDEGF